VNWAQVALLGEEQAARHPKRLPRSAPPVAATFSRVTLFTFALRANRQLATALRAQGINDWADHFAYRAQVCQRSLNLRRLRIPQYVGSLLLDVISGYGYKPGRSFITYLLVIIAFAAAFFALSTGALGIGGHDAINSPLSALVFSITSFHGRGFFPGEGLKLDDPTTVLAAVEAIMGLFIEITFIATFTQRFFGR